VSELRKDPIVNRWVMMAPERAERPIQIAERQRQLDLEFDPFAEGNESETAPELLAFRRADSEPNKPGWRVRVVPNKYPAVQRLGELERRHEGLYEGTSGFGAHEVIIECPQTEPNLSRLSSHQVTDVLTAYRDRLIELGTDRRLAYAMIFKNQGTLAGASVHHTHSQLIGTPFVPFTVVEELAGCQEYFDQHGRDIFETIVETELLSRSRVVLETPRFLAICPYASRVAYEMWIVPRDAGSHYEQIGISSLEELGGVLKTVLRKLEISLDDPAFNYVLHSAPFHQPHLPHYRWHFEILPRLTRLAGFEWGSGCYLNEVLPETAAKLLRETMTG
jgi:UDPglucose--hexose-1-phosphate uridylyltransferase